VSRNPAEIERTVAPATDDVDDIERYLDAGAEHLLVMTPDPFDLEPLQRLIDQRDRIQS